MNTNYAIPGMMPGGSPKAENSSGTDPDGTASSVVAEFLESDPFPVVVVKAYGLASTGSALLVASRGNQNDEFAVLDNLENHNVFREELMDGDVPDGSVFSVNPDLPGGPLLIDGDYAESVQPGLRTVTESEAFSEAPDDGDDESPAEPGSVEIRTVVEDGTRKFVLKVNPEENDWFVEAAFYSPDGLKALWFWTSMAAHGTGQTF